MKWKTRQSPTLGSSTKLAVASALIAALTATFAPSASAGGIGTGPEQEEQLVELFQPESATNEGLELKVEQKSSKLKHGMIALFGAAGIIGDVFGVNDCEAFVKDGDV